MLGSANLVLCFGVERKCHVVATYDKVAAEEVLHKVFQPEYQARQLQAGGTVIPLVVIVTPTRILYDN